MRFALKPGVRSSYLQECVEEGLADGGAGWPGHPHQVGHHRQQLGAHRTVLTAPQLVPDRQLADL
jgi:hypothetical protein